MVENLTTRAVLKDKISTAASDLVTRLDHGVKNLGRSHPTEEAPLMYKVTHKSGALVRSGHDTSSSQVHQLAAGETVTVVDLVGRRARIISPVEGWVSTETKDGVQIMRPSAMVRRGAQNEAFEAMFEQKFNRMKAAQGSQGSGFDPRAEGFDHKALPGGSPEDSPNSDDDVPRRGPARGGRDSRDRGSRDDGGNRDRGGRGRDDRDTRGRDDRDSRGKDDHDSGGPAFVPRLAAPGSKGGGPSLSSGAAGGGDIDLLSMGDDSSAQKSPAAVQQPTFDPFAGAPFAPAAPAAQAPGMPGAGADDWAGFQGGGAGQGFQGQGFQGGCSGQGVGGIGGGGQAFFNSNNLSQGSTMMGAQMQMGGQMPMGGQMAPSQNAGWAAGQMAPQMAPQATSWGMGQGQPQAGQAMGWGAGPQMGACGMQQQGQMGMQQMGMQQMGMQQMGMQQMGMQQPAQQSQNMGAFASPPPAYAGGCPAAPAPGTADDLLSRAMGGISSLGAQQRQGGQTSPMGMQMPMNTMGSQMR